MKCYNNQADYKDNPGDLFSPFYRERKNCKGSAQGSEYNRRKKTGNITLLVTRNLLVNKKNE